MDDSVFEFGLGLGFLGSFVVEGGDEFVSEVVEGDDDLLEGTLVSEVGVGSEFDEGSDEGSEGGVSGQGLLDSGEVGLDSLDLDQ